MLVKAYFQDLQFCVTAQGNITSWQQLEIALMAGCTISPLGFTMAMELIIRASKWVAGGQQMKNSLRLPPIRTYMDNMITITTTQQTRKLQENVGWAQMEIKPRKSRSICQKAKASSPMRGSS